MSKLDQIRDAIPPPPDWNQVARTMRDTIVPRMIDDLGDLLGTAPPPPSRPNDIRLDNISSPSQPPIDDYSGQLDNQEPEMNSNQELEDSGYSADDVRNQAPEIEFQEDETGGFDIIDPIGSLPEVPSYPTPDDEPGGWDHQPEFEEVEQPEPEQPELEFEPIPEQEEYEPSPPIPDGEGGGFNPIPDQGDTPSVPLPGGSPPSFDGNYKKHPDDPDGSG
ncbi:hypothetical protein JCM9152_4459 [Halalkalibacter hemicellulosilyticusJCM 9152]|uniref:Uncharacterized protein n=2 Tax=Halalkalibacter TaxID=2893056 RepID=W4QNE8_9BACI|nr:hypothetical protein JCM9152_4459 [Halalkalibacter hemicellulosilyticusJCM 9152]